MGDMFATEVPQNHENGPESGRGGSVWAETLSKRRPEAQDHFPSLPGSKNPVQKIENPKMLKILIFTVQSNLKLSIDHGCRLA